MPRGWYHFSFGGTRDVCTYCYRYLLYDGDNDGENDDGDDDDDDNDYNDNNDDGGGDGDGNDDYNDTGTMTIMMTMTARYRDIGMIARLYNNYEDEKENPTFIMRWIK